MRSRRAWGWRQALATLALAATGIDPAPAAPRLEPLDPEFTRLLPASVTIDKLTDGHIWLEGPAWDGRRGWLLFTDIPRNVVLRWRPGLGIDRFLEPSGYTGSAPFAGREPGANGLAFDARGRLVLAEHGDRRVARLEPDGRKTTLADRYAGRRLNSPNDVLYDRAGNLYFTDPPFGLPGTFADPARELDFCGVYRLAPDGTLTLLTRALQAPNGIALAPDESVLYVTDVGARRPAWWAFPLRRDGSLGAGRVFRDAAPFQRNGPGGPDGLETDRAGNLYASGPGGLYVFAPDARLLGRVDFGSAVSNVAWGERNESLYVTAGTAVYRIDLARRETRRP